MATVNTHIRTITETNYDNNEHRYAVVFRCPNNQCPGDVVNSAATGYASITGTAQVGQTLTAGRGTISDGNGVPNSNLFSYQWYRGSSRISGATSVSYDVQQADLNYRLKVRVSFEDDAGYSESRDSRQTSTVTAAVVRNSAATGYASITGTAQVGQTLTAGRGTISDGNGVPNSNLFSYQWYRGSSRISGATSVSYDVQQADLNYRLKVRVSFEDDAGYDESRDSRQTSTVTAAVVQNSAATGYASITGTAQVGQTLTAGRGTISDGNGVPNSNLFSYQWYRGSSRISGATSVSYDVQQADLNYRLKVRVSFEDDAGYDESRDSRQTSTVTAAVVQNSAAGGSLTISDTTPEVGQRLTADTSDISDNDGLSGVSYVYQWFSDNGYGSNMIRGATGRIYTVRSSDVGKRLRVGVDFSDDRSNSEALVSDRTEPVIRPCVSEGGLCATWDCCSGMGLQCINPQAAISNSEVCVECVPANSRCSSHSDCCQEKGTGEGLSCQHQGAFNKCKPCARYGESCAGRTECCPTDGLICDGRTCQGVED